jgi:hypothetical protein
MTADGRPELPLPVVRGAGGRVILRRPLESPPPLASLAPPPHRGRQSPTPLADGCHHEQPAERVEGRPIGATWVNPSQALSDLT